MWNVLNIIERPIEKAWETIKRVVLYPIEYWKRK